jgi:uncharacterized protein YkwD
MKENSAMIKLSQLGSLSILTLTAVFAYSGCASVDSNEEDPLAGDIAEDDEDVGSAEQAATAAACTNETQDAKDARVAMNNARTLMGMPAIDCLNSIRDAAVNHANYQGLNSVLSHTEVEGKPGFTGVNGIDRMKAAGFVGNGAGESISTGGKGGNSVGILMNQVSHRVPFASYTSGTYGFGNTFINGVARYATFDFGLRDSPNKDARAVWPAVNATGVKTSFTCGAENPNPCGTDANGVKVTGTVGYPLSLSAGAVLKDVTTKLVKTSNGTVLAHWKRMEDANMQVYLIPKAQLAALTKYTVTVTGTQNGAPFTKTWSFTTM